MHAIDLLDSRAVGAERLGKMWQLTPNCSIKTGMVLNILGPDMVVSGSGPGHCSAYL